MRHHAPHATTLTLAALCTVTTALALHHRHQLTRHRANQLLEHHARTATDNLNTARITHAAHLLHQAGDILADHHAELAVLAAAHTIIDHALTHPTPAEETDHG